MLKKKKPEPATIVVKPADNSTSLGQLKQSILELPCPNDLIIKNVKTKPSHFEIRANTSQGKDKLKNLIHDNVPNALIEGKRPRSVKIIFHNANRVDPVAFHNTLQDLGFDHSDIPDLDKPHIINSKTQDVHWVLTLNRAKALNTLLRNYKKDRPNFLHVGLQRLYYREYTRLIRCRHCQALDFHPTSLCNRIRHCENCGEKDCKNQPCTLPPVCINCYQFNGRLAAYPGSDQHRRDTAHKSSDSKCPTYRQGLINKMNSNHLDHLELNQNSHQSSASMAPKQISQLNRSGNQPTPGSASAHSTSRT